MAWWWVWWTVVAQAIGPTRGVVVFRTSPDAKVLLYPRYDPRRIDVMLRDNRLAIDDQVEGLTALHLEEIEARSIGGGTWFIKIYVDDESIVARPVLEPGRVVLYLEPGEPDVIAPVDVPPVETFLTDPPARRPEVPAPIALTYLRGDANTLTLRPQDIQMELPIWQTQQEPTRTSGWPAIDVYRSRLVEAPSELLASEIRYRLGLEHLGLGWYREAAYYFERVLNAETPYDVPAVALAAARAHLALGRSTRARELCRLAGESDAEAVDVLQCLGAAALIDGTPSPTHVGRALLAHSRRPGHRLLAGQLILSDHRFSEARRVLEAVAHGDPNARVMASLGDVRYATGDIAGAKLAWSEASAKNRRLSDQLRLRIDMAQMLEDGNAEWASHIPRLAMLAEESGWLGAEAHYLLAQVAETFGDPDLAAEHLNRMWDRFPTRAERSDVPERLVEVCNQRLRMLGNDGRTAKEVGFFMSCWRSELDMLTGNPEVLQRMANLLDGLGLPLDGLGLQQRALAIYTRLGEDDPAALAELTRLYVATGKPVEALQTLDYAEQLPTSLPAGAYLVAEAEARYAAGDVDGALQAWQLADAEGVASARRQMGLLLAAEGRCAQAGPYLAEQDDAESRLAHSRCLVRLGDNDAAMARLPLSDDDPWVVDDASWLSGVLAARGAELPLVDPPEGSPEGDEDAVAEAPKPMDPPGIWSRLHAEEQAASAFRQRLEDRMK